MDEDLDSLSREDLLAEIKKLRSGIREHRDSSGQELCWHHPNLWSLLPEKIMPNVAVPERRLASAESSKRGAAEGWHTVTLLS